MQSEYGLLIVLGALLILSPLTRSALERLGIPALVGYIGLGLLLNIVDQSWAVTTPQFDSVLSVLASLGVVALLFRVGLKSHTEALLAKLPDAALIWLGDVTANLILGFTVSYYVLGFTIETALVVATATSATSVAVSVGVWEETNKLDTSTGRLLLDVAELDDLSAVLLLAVVLAVVPVLQAGGGDVLVSAGVATSMVLAKLVIFIVGCYIFAYYLEANFTRFSREVEGSTTALTITILGAGLAIAAVAGYLGFSLAIGALFAGLAFSRDPEAVRVKGRFSYFHDFLTPFFFIHIGLEMSANAFLTSLGLGLVFVAVATAGKLLGVTGFALLSLPRSDAILLGVSMVPRAEIALVVVYQCRQLGEGLVSDELFAAMVLMSIVTSMAAPMLARRQLSKEGI